MSLFVNKNSELPQGCGANVMSQHAHGSSTRSLAGGLGRPLLKAAWDFQNYQLVVLAEPLSM